MFEIDRVYAEGLIAVDGSYADLLEKRDEILSNQQSYEESLAQPRAPRDRVAPPGAKARTRKSKARIDAAHRGIDELQDSRDRSVTESVGIELQASGRRTKTARGTARD